MRSDIALHRSTNNLRVSIGVPVYNGERFLQAALDTLLRQTFQDSTPPDPWIWCRPSSGSSAR
jgi:hypothetical protein